MTGCHAGRPRRSRVPSGRVVRRLGAILAATLAMAASLTVPAHASDSLPDPARQASLHIHLRAAHDPGSGLEPVRGAKFTIKRVQELDLSTTAGWRAATRLAPDFAPDSNDAADHAIADASLTLGDARSGLTDADGTVVFGSLPVGLYLVEEINPPPGALPIRPSLIALPMTDPDDPSRWLYDVDIFPKMSAIDITKTVDDSGAVGPSDIVSWTIRAAIPRGRPDGYRITDEIDTRLEVKKVAVALADGTPLTPDQYRIDGPGTDGLMTVEFTPTGLSTLAAHADTRVVVTIDTVVLRVGAIANSALLYPSAASFTLSPGDPDGPVASAPVVTKWGSVTIAKVDGAGRPLTGAVFSLYRSQEDARADRAPIELGGSTRFTVDARGLLTLSPLRQTSWADGHPVSDVSYYLAEISPPAGYERLIDPIRFQVDEQTSASGVDVSVANVAALHGVDLFVHALTGGSVLRVSSIALVFILMALSGGVLALLVRRRKRGGS